MKLKQFQLKNGLKVLFVESHKSPVISIQMWVRTGSADEKKKEEGISHFIEHLVFKGTRKYAVGEIAAAVEGAGGELNAYTSFDQTVFYVTVSKTFFQTGLSVISEMMGFPIFDPKEIDNEREVVIEEIKRGEDSPHRKASQLLFKTAFSKHPYGIPVIGYDKNVKELSAKKIKNFFHSRYAPRNMFLVVSGDFKSEEMKKQVSEVFGEFKDYPVKKISRAKEPKQKTPRQQFLKADFNESLIYAAFKVPNVKHKDIPALDVLALIMGQGDSSRLVHRLRIEEPVTNSVGAFAFSPADEGIFALSAGFDVKNLKKLLEGFLQEIEKARSSLPTAEELQKAITNIASEQVYSLETVDGIARKIGGLEFYMKDPKYFPKYLKSLYRLKPMDLTKVAQKYLTSKTLNLILTSNADKKTCEMEMKNFVQGLRKIEIKSKSPKLKPTKFKVKELKMAALGGGDLPKIEIINLPTGGKVILRHQKETPTVSVRLAFLGGLRIEKKEQTGISELLSRTWLAGTKNHSELEINHKIDSMAASLGAFSGRNSVGLSMDFLSNYEKPMAHLLEDVFLFPQWKAQVLEREKEILNHQIVSKNDNPTQVCMSQFMKHLFGSHPYSRETCGDLNTIKNIAVPDLENYYDLVRTSSNMVVCMVGDFDPAYWKNKFSELSEKIKKGNRLGDKINVEALNRDVSIYTQLEREQSHLVVGYRGLTLQDKDRFTLQILQSILSGQGGRLFIELRDKNSLAYSVSPVRMEGIETGYFGAYIGCSPEKVEKATQMIHQEFDKLCNVKVKTEELQRSQRYIVGRHDIDLQRKSAICNSILFDSIYGLDPMETFSSTEKYFSITAEDVQNLAQRIFKQKCVTSLVGPRSPEGFTVEK